MFVLLSFFMYAAFQSQKKTMATTIPHPAIRLCVCCSILLLLMTDTRHSAIARGETKERQIARMFAPRVYTTPSEYFPHTRIGINHLSQVGLTSRTVEDFKLPPKSVFDRTMPRYPNLWFYIDTRLAPSYEAAVKLVTGNLRTAMRLREFYGPFDNAEGCDFEVRLEHLQPWEVREQRALQHSHAFHMRYYFSALARQGLDQVKLGGRAYYRFGASVHYEVEHTNPNHADVEVCPICGRTGEYASLKGNLVEQVHDPLGLELVLTGRIRGETVRFEDWEQREVGSIEALKRKFAVRQHTFPAQTGDKNTLRIGVVVISPK